MEMAHYGNESEIMNEINKLKLQYTNVKSNLVSNEELFKYLKL